MKRIPAFASRNCISARSLFNTQRTSVGGGGHITCRLRQGVFLSLPDVAIKAGGHQLLKINLKF
jgi:hypothetical protein